MIAHSVVCSKFRLQWVLLEMVSGQEFQQTRLQRLPMRENYSCFDIKDKYTVQSSFFTRATLPELPDFNLVMNPSNNGFKLTATIVPRRKTAQSIDEIKTLKVNAAKKKFSHHKDKTVIAQYVEENLSMVGDSFANGKTMNYHTALDCKN